MIGYGNSMFLATHGILARTASGGGVDPDAQAFITAAAITDPTQQAAINTLVVDLKGYNIWSKMKALYPFCGSTASQHKWNLKDPRDLDAAFRLVFNGGITHSNNGVQFGGVNGWAETYFNPLTQSITKSNFGVSIYSRSNTSGYKSDIGAVDTGSYVWLVPRYSASLDFVGSYDDSNFNGNYLTNTLGLISVVRDSATTQKFYQDGVQKGTRTGFNATADINQSFYVGARNNIGAAANFTDRQHAFVAIHEGFNATEIANFYTAVQAFQTTIGRSIGTQTVSDADAQAFVTNAGIVDQVEANAINNLVIGLKADGLWAKMKAVYPFVGGTSTTHKFNLKNPLDTDAAFRLVFNGGWTHSSTGALPNGTNAYADTVFNPSTNFNTSTFNHLSYYSRTNSAIASEYVMGIYDGTSTNALICRRDTNLSFFVADYPSGTSYRSASGSVTDGRGLFLGTQTGANAKLFRNGSVIYSNTGATLNNAIANQRLYIGVLNNTTTIEDTWTDKECAFASIGEGLSDTEATNLNTRVTTFQTALNRNV